MQLLCICSLVFIYLLVLVDASSETDFAIVKARIIADYTPAVITSYKENLVRDMISDLLPTGKWPESNFKYTNAYNKPPWQHLDNIQAMTQAYVATGTLRRDPNLISKIHLALEYWFTANVTNGNWWWNSIGFRQYEGPICLLLQNVSALTTKEKSSCTTFLNRGATAGFTGANMVWTAQTQIYNAVLNSNIPYLSENFILAFNESLFTYGVDDGIKVDGSFFQHGPLEYSGGYGFAYTTDSLDIVAWAKDTVFTVPASNLAVLSTHVLDGQQWMVHLPSMMWDINCKGREITRKGGLTAKGFTGIKHPGGARASEWSQFIARFNNATNPKIGNRAFYTSDYMVHARKGWQTTFRGYSTRTRSAECINSEGKKSLHIADGANYLVRTGSEYYNVFPLWDWELIPGTTIEQDVVPVECSSVPPYLNYKGTGKTAFVGVVSNGMYGAAAHNLSGPQMSTLTAKKSWFFFDNEYVCLGADIVAPSSSRVFTNVDQKNLNGPVTVSSSGGGKTELSSTVYSNYASSWWAHHDSVGYIFPEWRSTNNTFKLNVDTTNKTGDWNTIGMNNASAAGFTFILSLPRKQSTTPDSYAYIVVPNVDVNTFESQASITKSQIQIKANTRNAQAIYHTALGQFHATFWTSGVPIDTGAGYVVRSLRSCLVIINPGSGRLDLAISDPSQLQKWTGISINKKVTCAECTYSDGYTTVNVTLPVYPYTGKTKVVSLVYA